MSGAYGKLLQGLAAAAAVLLGRLPWLRPTGDLVGLSVCGVLVVYGVRTILNSQAQGSMVFKSVVFPEWWLYAPVPLCFALLSIEFLRRLAGR